MIVFISEFRLTLRTRYPILMESSDSIFIRFGHMSGDREEQQNTGGIPANDNQCAAVSELLFRLARLLGRQAAEDQLRQLEGANDNSRDGGHKVDRA